MAADPVCVLASGGVESCALIGLLARAGRRVQPLYMAGALRWETVEQQCLARFIEACALPEVRPPVTLDCPVADLYGTHWSLGGGEVPGYNAPDDTVYLPGRNVLMLAKAAVYCALHDYGHVALGILRGNPFPDATPVFIQECARALSAGLGRALIIETPFADRTKVDVLREASGLPLHLSFSCLAPVGDEHCGACNKCRERRNAFAAAGLPDDTRYARGRAANAPDQ